MEILIAVRDGSGPDAVADLRDWLTAEPELRGRHRLVPRPPAEGELGGWADTLIVAVGAGGALTTLAKSLSVYLQQPRRSSVRVELVKADGTRLTLTAEQVGDLRQVESLLHAAADGPAVPAVGGAGTGETD
ncbi:MULTISPECIES: effector-associated constant component EACC1 [Streptacidiphilus]|uniref:Uncharacterized protein n=1 Tax=Streptacidiphilus cavernicola TaxID=3342716 RepID=A0ABV6UNI6_9ACTN|nr:hypothetical protein [Streptacidiphilus jeojiense]